MIKSVTLKNFRCHEHLKLTFHEPFVYIDGHNGSGKTSILEAIYFASTSKSHRSDELLVIQKGKPFAEVVVKTDDATYDIVMSSSGKKAAINHIEKRKLSDYIGKLKVVMFAPEDLDLIQGSPLVRRQFMDLEWMKLNINYLKDLNHYKQILKQRNSLLKRIQIDEPYTFLNILAEQLYEVAESIMKERVHFIETLNQYFKEVYKNFAAHQVEILYQPNSTLKQLRKHFDQNQKQDILKQSTNAGPHKDDFTITFEGYEAKSYASQGQQRLIVVSIKLALLKLIEERTNEHVVLLLDDVLSELDSDKQAIFLSCLPKDKQIIMNSAIMIHHDHIQKIHLPKE